MSGKLSKEQQEKLIEKITPLRERGWGCEAIAQRVDIDGVKVTASSINYYLAREGLVPRKGVRRQRHARPYTNCRGVTVRQFTPEDDQQLQQLRTAGKTISEICRAMGRRHNSITHRLYVLALREESTVQEGNQS